MNSKIQIVKIITKGIALGFIFTSCQQYGNKKNPLCGLIYSNHKEIHQLSKFEEDAGALLDIKKANDFELGIIQLSNKKQNVLVLEKLMEHKNSNDVKYQILDTINVIPKIPYIQIGMCHCFEKSIYKPAIAAIVIKDMLNDSEVSVRKAWQVDIESGKLIEIKNQKNIRCANEFRGMKGE